MRQVIILASFIAFSAAQFPQPDYLNIPGVTPPPWQGPLADHINGIPPKDTPEVAAAKAALNQAYAQVLAVLPELPPEERYRTNHQHIPVPQYIPMHGHHFIHHNIVPQPQQPVLAPVAPMIKTFAEEIPRSPIGEVPEVHAARVAHLKAVQEAAAALPHLADIHIQQTIHHVHPTVPQHPGLLFQDYLLTQQAPAHHVVQDTPEVAKAKADHAAAVAAALG